MRMTTLLALAAVGLFFSSSVWANLEADSRRQHSAPAVQTEVPFSQGLTAAQVQRGRGLQEFLHEALNQTYWETEQLPVALEGAEEAGLVAVDVLGTEDRHLDRMLGLFAVVVHEPVEDNSDGIWVGYGNGSLEFVREVEDLERCKGQLDIATAAAREKDALKAAEDKANHADDTDTPDATDESDHVLRLRVVAPDGQPLEGAQVGVTIGSFTDPHAVYFYPDDPSGELLKVRTDEAGIAEVPHRYVYRGREAAPGPVSLVVFERDRDLIAVPQVRNTDFDRDGEPRVVRLEPACRVIGTLTSFGLGQEPPTVRYAMAYVARQNESESVGWAFMDSADTGSDHSPFELLLPPGDHLLHFYGSHTVTSLSYIRIEPGQTELKLHFDLPPQPLKARIGKPAPELRQIRGWMNGGPVTLEQLRGKVVLLDFWGIWCGPCLVAMPDLMDLHDKYKDEGLVIIAVHDDSREMSEIEAALKEFPDDPRLGWNGRALPFLIALDGGGKTRVEGSFRTQDGATTAAYGINGFPTTVLIGRDGTLIDEVDFRGESPEDEAKLKAALAGD